MFRSGLRLCMYSTAVVVTLMVNCAVADVPAPPDKVAGAYGVLERLGLLKPAAKPEPAPAPAPAAKQQLRETVVGPAQPSAAVASAEGVARSQSSHAYQVLRRLGLLKSDPSAPGAALLSNEPRVDRVVVEKSRRRLYLLRNGQKYREYPVVLGAVPWGPKQKAGDLRTPEGTYTLDWRNPKSRYYKSIHISYPSSEDRTRAEEKGVDPGGMIMLHGEHDEPAMRQIYRRKPKDWTEGCIALNNEHMEEIWQAVPVGTPIEIKP